VVRRQLGRAARRKLDIKGRPVFICCKGCRKKAEADPDRTLAKVEELKAKAKDEREAKK
jgi:hypothetical protein